MLQLESAVEWKPLDASTRPARGPHPHPRPLLLETLPLLASKHGVPLQWLLPKCPRWRPLATRDAILTATPQRP
jgi:hypothetical protein